MIFSKSLARDSGGKPGAAFLIPREPHETPKRAVSRCRKTKTATEAATVFRTGAERSETARESHVATFSQRRGCHGAMTIRVAEYSVPKRQERFETPESNGVRRVETPRSMCSPRRGGNGPRGCDDGAPPGTL
jgi:hypothetical protein